MEAKISISHIKTGRNNWKEGCVQKEIQNWKATSKLHWRMSTVAESRTQLVKPIVEQNGMLAFSAHVLNTIN